MRSAITKLVSGAPCPCGGAQFVACCGRFIAQQAIPQSAQELMRSRYTAYALRDDVYLSETWHRSTRPASVSTTSDDDGLKWLGLEIKKHTTQGDHATVEFVARYKVVGRAHRLHEVSQFVREREESELAGEHPQSVFRWFYVDGVFPENN